MPCLTVFLLYFGGQKYKNNVEHFLVCLLISNEGRWSSRWFFLLWWWEVDRDDWCAKCLHKGRHEDKKRLKSARASDDSWPKPIIACFVRSSSQIRHCFIACRVTGHTYPRQWFVCVCCVGDLAHLQVVCVCLCVSAHTYTHTHMFFNNKSDKLW